MLQTQKGLAEIIDVPARLKFNNTLRWAKSSSVRELLPGQSIVSPACRHTDSWWKSRRPKTLKARFCPRWHGAKWERSTKCVGRCARILRTVHGRRTDDCNESQPSTSTRATVLRVHWLLLTSAITEEKQRLPRYPQLFSPTADAEDSTPQSKHSTCRSHHSLMRKSINSGSADSTLTMKNRSPWTESNAGSGNPMNSTINASTSSFQLSSDF